MRNTVFLLMSILLTGGLMAQSSPPCNAEFSGQFDFWIGEWDVYQPNGTLAGHNSIQPLYPGCMLQEKWEGAQGSKGTSLNFYNPTDQKWEQFWVYQNGTTLHLQGGIQGKSMVMEGESAGQDGKPVMNRITWTPNADGTVRQHWEFSKDGGASFQTAFDGLYKPKKA